MVVESTSLVFPLLTLLLSGMSLILIFKMMIFGNRKEKSRVKKLMDALPGPYELPFIGAIFALNVPSDG